MDQNPPSAGFVLLLVHAHDMVDRMNVNDVKHFRMWISLAVIAALLVVGYFVQSKKGEAVPATTQTIVPASPTDPRTATVTFTIPAGSQAFSTAENSQTAQAGWKTFINPVYEYSIQYPENVRFNPQIGENDAENIVWRLFPLVVPREKSSKDFAIQMREPLMSGCDFEHANYRGSIDGNATDISHITLGGNEYLTYDYFYKGGTELIRAEKMYEIRRNNKCYYMKLMLFGYGVDQGFNLDLEKKVIEQMLSTLVFGPMEPHVTDTSGSGDVITQQDWGVSFVKDGYYVVTRATTKTIVLYRQKDPITIEYSVGDRITTDDAKLGSMTFWLDQETQQWVRAGRFDAATGQQEPDIMKVVPKFYTATSQPVFVATGNWLTYVVPLSPTRFLKLSIKGPGAAEELTQLVKTIKVL